MSGEQLDIHVEARLGDFSLAVRAALPASGVTGIFGPSGSGKTSLLRLIAGFIRPDKGHISWPGAMWTDTSTKTFTPPHKRDIGYVFQDARLLTHRSVSGNLAYAEKRAAARAQKFTRQDIVEACQLGPLLERMPEHLSGGERQRVALGLALLTRPHLLLLDEPLVGLDMARKDELLPYLERVRSEFGVPMLYVSHDVSEVSQIADNVLIMKDGQAAAFGETVATLNAHAFGAEGEGRSASILPGKISRIDNALQFVEVDIGGAALRLPLTEPQRIGAPRRILVKARDVSLALTRPEGLSIQNILPGTVSAVKADASRGVVHVSIDIGQAVLPVQITRAAFEALKLQPGLSVFALIKSASLLA